jgi:carbon-monoxide dehydrogenase large subunit
VASAAWAKGGTIGAPAAIANALADALAPLGAEIFELPMTPERLFRLIGAADDGVELRHFREGHLL